MIITRHAKPYFSDGPDRRSSFTCDDIRRIMLNRAYFRVHRTDIDFLAVWDWRLKRPLVLLANRTAERTGEITIVSVWKMDSYRFPFDFSQAWRMAVTRRVKTATQKAGLCQTD